MEITFLLGNGLDLNCGCKSSYKDIYEYYIQQPSNNEWIKRLKKEISTWGDFEMEMAKFVSTCQSEQEAINCIRDFKRQMDRHLQFENNRMENEIKEDEKTEFLNQSIIEEIERSIKNFYSSCIPNVSNEIERRMRNAPVYYNFISFNYTTFLDQLIIRIAKELSNQKNKSISKDMYCRLPTLIHIHGTLGGNELVGIDNKEQFGEITYNHEALEKNFIKPLLNFVIDLQRFTDATDAIKNADIICVFGMSLGDSDLTWRTKIIEWLQKNEFHHLFLYDYSQCGTDNYLIDEKMDAEDKAKREFLTKCNIETNGIERQIHIPIGQNIFNIKKCLDRKKQIKIGKQTVQKILMGVP
ncbi:MAG: hypothetical protein J5885_02045 [Clostridia bacterium]|nr:hypothetical protein [Clostridia bacterium]